MFRHWPRAMGEAGLHMEEHSPGCRPPYATSRLRLLPLPGKLNSMRPTWHPASPQLRELRPDSPKSVTLAQRRRGEFPPARDMPTPDVRLYHRAVVVAQDVSGQLRGLVRQLSIDQVGACWAGGVSRLDRAIQLISTASRACNRWLHVHHCLRQHLQVPASLVHYFFTKICVLAANSCCCSLKTRAGAFPWGPGSASPQACATRRRCLSAATPSRWVDLTTCFEPGICMHRLNVCQCAEPICLDCWSATQAPSLPWGPAVLLHTLVVSSLLAAACHAASAPPLPALRRASTRPCCASS